MAPRMLAVLRAGPLIHLSTCMVDRLDAHGCADVSMMHESIFYIPANTCYFAAPGPRAVTDARSRCARAQITRKVVA